MSKHHPSPNHRPRRHRLSPWIRSVFAPSPLAASDLIYPLFISNENTTVNQYFHRYNPHQAAQKALLAYKLGIPAVILFPYIPSQLKDSTGSHCLSCDNILAKAIAEIKETCPEIGIIVDIALDPYTSHGHDGLIDANGIMINDKTVEILTKMALHMVKIGADALAPSDMSDGRILAIRQGLDANSHEYTPILSYSAKYCSNFYQPFRQCVGSQNLLQGNKLNYQLSPSEFDGAMNKIAIDIFEGADAVIVKPSSPYLDILHAASREFTTPIISYQTSGEYAMLRCAADNGILDFYPSIIELLLAVKRAGAASCITYAALEVAQWIANK